MKTTAHVLITPEKVVVGEKYLSLVPLELTFWWRFTGRR